MANEPHPGSPGHPGGTPAHPGGTPAHTGTPGRPNATGAAANPNPLGLPPHPDEGGREASAMAPRTSRRATRVKADPRASAMSAQQIDPVRLAASMVAVQKAVDAHTSNQLPTPDLDKCHPGGHYLVEGKHVDAWGQEIEEPEEEEDDDDDEDDDDEAPAKVKAKSEAEKAKEEKDKK